MYSLMPVSEKSQLFACLKSFVLFHSTIFLESVAGEPLCLCGASFCVFTSALSAFLGVIRHCVVSMIGSNILTWIFCGRRGGRSAF